MAITVTLYQFAKRKNSTALPTSGTSSVDVSVLLKDRCSGESPVLELESNDPSGYLNYNYAYIAWFGRYYFISRREYDTGSRIYLYLEEDYLGSFKSAIQLSTAFVKYSSAGVYTIPDSRIPRTKDYTVNTASAAFPSAVGGNNYFVSVTGVSRTATYSISKTNLLALFSAASWVSHSPASASDTTSAITNLATMLGEAIDDYTTQGAIFNNLRSAYILPFPPDEEVLSSAQYIFAGHYNTEIQGYEVLVPVFSQAIAISIPWNTSDWTRCAPYSQVYLYLPFFGIIPLDTNSLVNSSYLTVKYSICYSDGGLSYSVETDTNRIVATGSTNVRSEYGIGSSNTSLGNIGAYIPSLVGNASNVWSQGLQAIGLKGLGSALNTLAGISDSFGGGFSTSGGIGGLAATGLELRLKCWCITKNFSETQANFSTFFGIPTFKVMSLSGLTGYVETEDFFFDYSGATAHEKNIVGEYLNQGIYLE